MFQNKIFIKNFVGLYIHIYIIGICMRAFYICVHFWCFPCCLCDP